MKLKPEPCTAHHAHLALDAVAKMVNLALASKYELGNTVEMGEELLRKVYHASMPEEGRPVDWPHLRRLAAETCRACLAVLEPDTK